LGHKQGKAPEEILVAYPDLSLAQVALACYYDHNRVFGDLFGELDQVGELA
jgi:uncharacterized protein (DUF433 family)